VTILLYGLVSSVTLALYAVGFSLVYGVSGIANFAHGAIYILSGYLIWMGLNLLNLPYWISFLIALGATALVGFALYWILLYRVRGIPLAELVVTFGTGVAILEFMTWAGFSGIRYSLPPLVYGSLEIFGVSLDYQRLLVLASGIVLVAGLYLFVHHTRIGLAFRALAQSERTALSVGIESDWVGSLSMAMGSAISAVSAIAVLPLGIMEPTIGYEVLIYALAVAIVGGLESTPGMVVGGFLIGYGQLLTARLFGPKWMIIVPLLLIVLVLAIRPSGIFGKMKELEERV
jgi:branched-chain amino acid transport system permease protein